MKSKNKRKKFKKKIKKNQTFIYTICLIAVLFTILVYKNIPVTTMSSKGIDFLNKYEFPTSQLTVDNCMVPYDVGDGVITFGPGITYPSLEEGYNAINQSLGTKYSTSNGCILEKDLLKWQKQVIKEYEQIVNNVSVNYNIDFNQNQFNGLVLLAYNSPNVFKDEQFLAVITNPNSSIDEYITAADNYYQTLSGYDTKFGNGWYNRIVDSAQMYYNGDYEVQN